MGYKSLKLIIYTKSIYNMSKKVTLKTNVKILHAWGKREDLTKFLRGKTTNLQKYNMLYVVQSKNDVENNVYKVGVSAGVGRIKEYTKHHGESGKGKCAGVFLLYLVGTIATSRSRKSAQGKIDAEIRSGYIYRLPWSRKRETEIKRELKKVGFKAVRGTEWFHVPPSRKAEFVKTVTSLNRVVLEEAVLEPRRSDRLKPTTNRYSERLRKKATGVKK